MTNSFRKRLAQGELLIGTIITLPTPEISEILSQSGVDWLFIDLEHSALSIQDAQIILQVASPYVPCIIRIPSNEELWIKKCLDIGAAGIIVPQLRGAADAERALRDSRYPPQGSRSVGIGRAHGYGAKFREYVKSANEEIAVILQIEHVDAVNDIDEILKVPGIDCLFVGPYDLSASMGKIGQIDAPDVQEAIGLVKQRADRAHKPLGIFGVTPQAVKPYIQNGYKLIVVSSDASLLGGAAGNMIASLKE
jgi:2-keto-3-deoxy-L-rhamnonate aldolase RhmA